MAEIPWWAWIAIIAIVMWGLMMIANSLAYRTARKDPSAIDREEFERLKRRVEDLEYRAGRRD